MTNAITPILLPKWGMDMEEGKIGVWLVSEGEQVTAGSEVLEIESEKVTNVLDATADGVLRRQLVKHGDIYPIGTLLGVIAAESVSDDSLLDFISNYEASPEVFSNIASPAFELIDSEVEIDDQRLHYTSVGDSAKTVVLIHGFGGNLSSWGGLQMALASSCRVVSVELPGHGTSSKQIAGGTSLDFAHLLLTFLDKLEIGDVHLVGHSLGGAIAAQMSMIDLARIKSLTLISNYGLATKVDVDYIDEFLAAKRRKGVKLALKKLFFDGIAVSSDMIEGVLRLKRLEGAEQALHRIADAIRAEQVGEARIELPLIPTQIIIGEADKIIKFDDALLAKIENLTLIENAAHMPQVEQAAHTQNLIKNFLDQYQDLEHLQA